ncbi:MAG: glycosyltransferase [Ignavibacteriales bacterium]
MKKVLFITYYWPPSGKASLHWPLKIIKHLPKSGWTPVVLTADEDTFSQKDDTFANEISREVEIIRAKSFEPFNIYKIFTGKKKDDQLVASETISQKNKSLSHRLSIWIRMNLFVPDARIGWYFPAVKKGIDFLNKEKVDAIVSVGPPHTTHLVAKKIAAKHKLPFVPVFIDPWTDIAYYKDFKRNVITKNVDSRFEKSVLENSEAVVFVTKTMCSDYLKKYPSIKNKSNVLYWGYSEEEFENLNLKQNPDDQKTIIHAGNIFSYQNPVNFWNQVKKEIDNRTKLKLKFIGTIDPSVKDSINKAGLSSYTEYLGFLPYKKMLEEVCNAQFLVVCASEPRHVPGKLFEYLRTGKPIIAFGNNNSEVKDILRETNSGMMFSYSESGNEFFEQYKNFQTKMEVARKFEREIIAADLGKILDSL